MIKKGRKTFKGIPGRIAAGLTVVVVLIAAAYRRDMNRAYARVRGKSTVISSPYGDIEYTEGGAGPLSWWFTGVAAVTIKAN